MLNVKIFKKKLFNICSLNYQRVRIKSNLSIGLIFSKQINYNVKKRFLISILQRNFFSTVKLNGINFFYNTK